MPTIGDRGTEILDWFSIMTTSGGPKAHMTQHAGIGVTPGGEQL